MVYDLFCFDHVYPCTIFILTALSIYFLFKNNTNYLSLVLIASYVVSFLFQKYDKYRMNLKVIKKMQNEKCTDISVFPSGKIILFSYYYIKILDNNNYELLQQINNKEISYLSYIDIIDENNFCVFVKNEEDYMMLFSKINNIFIFKKSFYFPNTNFLVYINEKYLITVSDNNIKIWKKNINYQIQLVIKEDHCNSVLYNKNILISSGRTGTKIYSTKKLKLKLIREYKDIICLKTKNGIQKIDNDRFIILSNLESKNILNIISLSKNQIVKVIKSFDVSFTTITNHTKENNNYIFVGSNHDIYIYDKNNYKFQPSKTIRSYMIIFKLKKIVEIGNNRIVCLTGYGDLIFFKY